MKTKIKEITVEYFYTKQPAAYESERVTVGFTMDVDVDSPDVESTMDAAVDHCMSVVHRRLGLVKKEKECLAFEGGSVNQLSRRRKYEGA